MRFIKRQQQYFLIGLVFVILGFLGKIIYRPFIYANNIHDLGIADSLPGFFYVIGFAFMLSIIQIKKTDIIIAIVTLASIVYEFYQFWQDKTFDFSDVIYSIHGGIVAMSIHFLLKRRPVDIK
jgi:hypothetical protein